MAVPIDPDNAQGVGRDGRGNVHVAMPRALMPREEALVHAAWLVAVADDDDEFAAYLAAVRGT